MVPLRARLAGACRRALRASAAILLAAAAALTGAGARAESGPAAVPGPAPSPGGVPETATELLRRWLGRQATIRTWSAEFTQIRRLKTLAQPLVAQGRVRFAAPNRFHWELGDPAQTLAIRQSNAVLIVYPALRRAERYPLEGADTGPWKSMLSLLEVGFPESLDQLEARFKVAGVARTATGHEVLLEPRAAAARRLMPRFRILLSDPGLDVTVTEMEFADGSSLRNEFRDARINPPLEDRLFEPELGPEYRITEPLRRTRP